MTIMPKKMQVMKLQDELRRQGIAPDIIDIDAQVSRKPELLDQWFKHPGQIDIMGIDVFGSSKLRRTRKKRR